MQAQAETKVTPTPARSPTQASGRLLQRKCACGGAAGLTGECEDCSGERLTLQRRASDQAELSAAPPIVNEVLRSPGRPLDPATRAFMEPRFGHNFGHVRVHTDARAADSARAVHALAYTVGQDVVFGAGQYAPQTTAGRKLLAHELTHTIQQAAYASAAAPQSPITVESAETSLERTADGSASRLTANAGLLAPSPKITLQRAPAPPDEIEMPAEYAFALDKSKRTDKNYAWAQGRKDVARMKKSGKLSPEDKQEIIAKLRFFQGEAKAAYLNYIAPTLSEVSQEVADILNESNRPEVNPCDVGKQQYLLEYEDDPGKFRCMDIKTDPEYLNNLFDENIAHADAYAVKGTTWENVKYKSFNVIVVKYKKGKPEYFMLDEVPNFHYAETTRIIREFTFLKRTNGLLYPIAQGRLYLNETLTPNILGLKNAVQYRVKELQDLYTLAETTGAFASIISTYAITAGFRESLEGFRINEGTRAKTTEPEPTTTAPSKRTEEPTTPPKTRTDEPSVSSRRTTTEPEPTPPKQTVKAVKVNNPSEAVKFVNEHPDVIEGKPGQRRARVSGDHEIVEVRDDSMPAGIGCEFHSNGGPRVPCPQGMGTPQGARQEPSHAPATDKPAEPTPTAPATSVERPYPHLSDQALVSRVAGRSLDTADAGVMARLRSRSANLRARLRTELVGELGKDALRNHEFLVIGMPADEAGKFQLRSGGKVFATNDPVVAEIFAYRALGRTGGHGEPGGVVLTVERGVVKIPREVPIEDMPNINQVILEGEALDRLARAADVIELKSDFFKE